MSRLLLVLAGGGGGTLDPLDLDPLLWLKADAGTFQTDGGSAAEADGDPVGLWQDQSGNGDHATQGTAAARGTLKLAIQNGLPVVRLDGTDDFYSLTGLTAASGPHTFFAAINPGNLAGAGSLKYLFDAATGRLILACATSADNKVGFFDGAWDSIADGANGFQILSWVLGSGTGSVRRNGTSLGSAAYTNTAIGGAVGLGASNDGAGSRLACDIGEVLLYGSLTAGQVAQVEAYLLARWGV